MGRASAEESGTGRGRRKPFAGRGAAPGWARPTRTFFFADWPFTRWTLTLDGPARVIPRMAATFVATPDARPRRAFPTAFISSAVPTKPTRATPRARAPEPRRDLPRRHASRSPLADRRTHLVRRPSPEVATACAARRAVGTLMVRLFFPLISRSVGRCSTAGRGETPMPRRLFRLGCPMVPRESASASFHRDSRARSRDRGGRIPRARGRTTASALGNDVRPRKRRDAGRTAESLARTRTSGRHVSRVQGSGPAMADGEIRVVAHGGVPRAKKRGRAPGVPEPPVAEVQVGYDGVPAVEQAAHEVFGALVLALQARGAAVSASDRRGGPRGGHSRG